MKRIYFLVSAFALVPSFAAAEKVPMYQPPPEKSRLDPRVERLFAERRRAAEAAAAQAIADQEARVRAASAQAQAEQAQAQARAQIQAAEQVQAQAQAQVQKAMQARDQALALVNSEQVQGVIGALQRAKGDIQQAAAIRAEQEIENEKGRLRATGVVHKIDAGIYLGTGPRLFGFGTGAMTSFGAGITFVQSNWRGWVKVGGRWSYGGFSAPDGIEFCKPDTKPQLSDRCMRPDDKGNIDWGAPALAWNIAAGAEYNLFARFRVRGGLQVIGDSYAYTPRDSASTVKENNYGFGVLASFEATSFGPFPVGIQIEANRASYITPYGDKRDGANGFFSIIVNADFLNNMMSVQRAQQAQ